MLTSVANKLIGETGAVLIQTQRLPFPSDLTSTEAIFLCFGLMILGVVLTGAVIGLNAFLARRDQRVVQGWLESKGNTVQKIEWVIYPTLKFTWSRHFTFEARFTDSGGRRHHAFMGQGIFGETWIIEDNVVPESLEHATKDLTG
jgi:hypothetical protein